MLSIAKFEITKLISHSMSHISYSIVIWVQFLWIMNVSKWSFFAVEKSDLPNFSLFLICGSVWSIDHVKITNKNKMPTVKSIQRDVNFKLISSRNFFLIFMCRAFLSSVISITRVDWIRIKTPKNSSESKLVTFQRMILFIFICFLFWRKKVPVKNLFLSDRWGIAHKLHKLYNFGKNNNC